MQIIFVSIISVVHLKYNAIQWSELDGSLFPLKHAPPPPPILVLGFSFYTF